MNDLLCPLAVGHCIQAECAWWSRNTQRCAVLNISEFTRHISCKMSDVVTTFLDGTVSNKMFVDGAGGDNVPSIENSDSLRDRIYGKNTERHQVTDGEMLSNLIELCVEKFSR